MTPPPPPPPPRFAPPEPPPATIKYSNSFQLPGFRTLKVEEPVLVKE
jgi:hypothetical protein